MPVFGIPKQPLNPTLTSGYAAYRRPTRADPGRHGTDSGSHDVHRLKHRTRKTTQPVPISADLVRLLCDRRLLKRWVCVVDHVRRPRAPDVPPLDQRLASMSADRRAGTGGHARHCIEIVNAECRSSACSRWPRNETKSLMSCTLTITKRTLAQVRCGGQGHGRTADLPLFRPDISPVGAERASVMRCRRSLLSAVGCCCCCHRCCQPGPVPVSMVSLAT